MKKLSISEAKNKLPGIIHEVEMGESIQLTRHGQPAALIISIEEYRLLVSRRKSFSDAIASFRDGLSKDSFIEDDILTDLRAKDQGREVLL